MLGGGACVCVCDGIRVYRALELMQHLRVWLGWGGASMWLFTAAPHQYISTAVMLNSVFSKKAQSGRVSMRCGVLKAVPHQCIDTLAL